ncbi:MAG: hypothetical protein IJA34_00660 [Lachnospiraceae bacterium]|nr:hypothetical protein [Lachnospiraceae bacterium]
MLSEKIINILEANDIIIHKRNEQNGIFYREIEFYSSEGEDVIETVWYDGTEENFVNGFKKLADDFDADDHAEMWINNRNNSGVPQSIRALIDDAEEIKNTLVSVANQLLIRDEEKMTIEEFYDYIIDNFNVSREAAKLIDNICSYAIEHQFQGEDLFSFLNKMLDSTIGLDEKKIRRVVLLNDT